MKIKETVGIDVSKSVIDLFIHGNKFNGVFKNSVKGYKEAIKSVFKTNNNKKENTLFIFEHTGIYSYGLATFLAEKNISFALVPGLAVKRSLGIVRGKNDRIDAKHLALYAYRLRDEIEPYTMPPEKLLSLKRLLLLRDRLVKQRSGYKASVKEQSKFLSKSENKLFFDVQKKMINELDKQVQKIEIQIDSVIDEDAELSEIFRLLTGIKGVGKQTAVFMIVYTNAFTSFKTWRKFASYCGTAPFPNSSGSSLKGRTKVSNLANKKLKSLLDLCAKSAIQFNPEMKAYYERRVEEGKNKRSTINITIVIAAFLH
jgi:transposase